MSKEISMEFKFNFKINDPNPEIKLRNLFVYKISFLVLFIFLVLLTPFYIYMYIVFNNVNLDIYFDHYASISQYVVLPSKLQIIGTIWAAIGLLFFAIISILLFKPVTTSSSMNKNYQVGYIAIVTMLLTLVLLFAALSQYQYSQFQDFFIYEAKTIGDNKLEEFREISKIFTNNYNNNIDNFKWESSNTVWWVMFFQIMVVFASSVSMQNSLFGRSNSQGIEKYILYSIRVKGLSRSKTITKLNSIFKIGDKNLSIWMIVIAGITIAPQLIFAILSSADTTNIHSLFDWTYTVPNLLMDYENGEKIWDVFTSFISTRNIDNDFIINSFPIILIGITLSTSFFFISVMIRGENTSSGIFFGQYIIMLIELLAVLSFSTYTKFELNAISNLWMENGVKFEQVLQEVVKNDLQSILELHPLNTIINHADSYEWLSRSSMIAETIISYSFVLGGFSLIGLGMTKSNQLKNSLVGISKDVN